MLNQFQFDYFQIPEIWGMTLQRSLESFCMTVSKAHGTICFYTLQIFRKAYKTLFIESSNTAMVR